jgi:hypothetical protein
MFVQFLSIQKYMNDIEEQNTKCIKLQIPTLLTKAEMTLIFAKVEPILKVHTKILEHITSLVTHWDEQRPVARVFVDVASFPLLVFIYLLF